MLFRPAEWAVVPHTAVSAVVSVERGLHPEESSILRDVGIRIMDAPQLSNLGPFRIAFMQGLEAVFSVGLDRRPHPLHLDRIQKIGLHVNVAGDILPRVRKSMRCGERIICPATPHAILGLLGSGLRITISEYIVPQDATLAMASEEVAYSVQPTGNGVIGSWWSGPWRLCDLALASQSLEASRSGIRMLA